MKTSTPVSRRRALGLLGAAPLAMSLRPALAATEPVKVGLIVSLSGAFASSGQLMVDAARLFLETEGRDMLGGRSVELVLRDDGGNNPELAKRLVQELVTRDRVRFLGGFGFTPNANAVAPLLNQAKVPCLLFNASASAITPRSPWFVRTAFTQWQINQPLGEWAATKRGWRRAYVLVADFAPGHEAQEAFTKGFTSQGGEILGAVRMPIQRPDFVPFLLRAKEAKPDVLFVFHPGGVEGSAFLRAYVQSGLREAGVQLIGTSDLTSEDELHHTGKLAEGVITAGQYSLVADRPANRRFVEAWRKAYPDSPLRPTYNAVGAWDGMRAICAAIAATDGGADSTAATRVLSNFSAESPRGPISIDPATRDIVQNVYLREVRPIDNAFGDHYGNVEFDVVPQVKDPWKAANPG